MQLAAFPRYYWIIIGLVVGTIVGLVTDSANGPLYGVNVQGYGMLLPDPLQFENGLVQDYNGTRLFSDPVVYPHWTRESNGQRKLVYIVAGEYWDGRSQIKNGKAVAEWLPRCIITQTPYRPRIGVTDEKGVIAREFPSVVQFLDALHRSYKVNYRYAWWALHPVLTWIVGCLILIGGVWPTVVNLLAYGSLTRPADIMPVSLWNIRGSKPHPTPQFAYSAQGTDRDDELSVALELPLETPETNPAPAQPLATAPLEPVPQSLEEHRSYGAKKDDFYPTERHVPRAKP